MNILPSSAAIPLRNPSADRDGGELGTERLRAGPGCALIQGKRAPVSEPGPFCFYFFLQASSPFSTSSRSVLPVSKSPRRIALAIRVSAELCRYRFSGRAP